MTKNKKIAIGIGAVALGYWLYTKNKASKSVETPASPSAPATSSTTGNTTFEPPTSSLPKKINVHNCKDGFKINVPDYGMMTFAKVQDPCWNHGGTVNYDVKPNTITDDYKFEVIENFTAEYFNSSTGKYGNATFKKGQIIHAKPIPMGNKGGLSTSIKGEYPIMGMIGGTPNVTLPENKLRRL